MSTRHARSAVRLSAACVCGALLTPAHAATIAWSSTAYVNSPNPLKNVMGDGTTQLAVDGTLVYAENTGGAAATFTNNGAGGDIAFLAGAVDFDGPDATFGGFHENTATNNVSRTGLYSTATTLGPNTVTLGVGGVATLVPGLEYRVQLLFMDGRDLAGDGRTMEVDGIDQGAFETGTTGISWGDGLLVTGTFTADALTQTFTVEVIESDGTTSAGGQLNALILHQVPEPASALLVAAGSLLIVARRRRA